MSLQQRLQLAWSDVTGQWAANARLRLGLMSIAAICWVYLLMLAADQSALIGTQAQALRDEAGRVRPLAKEQVWPQRADDARQQLAAVQSMLWTDSDAGLIEARLQDWLRSTAAKAGLSVRELTMQRGTSTLNSTSEATAKQPGEPLMFRARLVLDLNRLALLGFLAELGRNEQVWVVERLALRPGAQPALAEIELKAFGMIAAPSAAASAASGGRS